MSILLWAEWRVHYYWPGWVYYGLNEGCIITGLNVLLLAWVIVVTGLNSVLLHECIINGHLLRCMPYISCCHFCCILCILFFLYRYWKHVKLFLILMPVFDQVGYYLNLHDKFFGVKMRFKQNTFYNRVDTKWPRKLESVYSASKNSFFVV